MSGLLTEYFVTKEQNAANDDVNMAIEAEMPENPVAVADIIDKRAREIERKYKAKLGPIHDDKARAQKWFIKVCVWPHTTHEFACSSP